MKNYEKPIVMINEELAEGVYATGSGNGSIDGCWKFTYALTPNNDVYDEGTGCEIAVHGDHTNPGGHNANFTLNIVLNQTILSIPSFSGADSCDFVGNTLIVSWYIGTSNATESKEFNVRVAVADSSTLKVVKDECNYTCPV